MNYQHYSPEFKVKVVLQVLQGEKEIGELAQEYSINPNLIRKWKTEFLEKASMVFEDRRKRSGRRNAWRRKSSRCSERSVN